MKRITLPITFRVQGPILTRSSSIGEPGVDAPMASGMVWNQSTGVAERRFYLPGRLIKGLLREAWQELAAQAGAAYDAKFIREWLGDESVKDTGDAPLRGRLAFSDFADYTTAPEVHSSRCRIVVDEVRGAADAAKLQLMDSPYASFDEPAFEGRIRFMARKGENYGPVLDAVERGLLWIRAVGGIRTSGFGLVAGVMIGQPLPESPHPCAAPAGDTWDLRVRFEELVILAKRRVSENLFESGDIVAGGALKGAVAAMIECDPIGFAQLKEELHSVRFTHAFPAAKGGTRPRQWPLSRIAFEREDRSLKFADAMDLDENHMPYGRAGAFEIDWKDETKEAVRKRCGWPEVKWELRVRTAIDSAKRVSRDQQLFAWQMLIPFGLEWLGQVDISPLSAAARDQLATLLAFGVEPLGKTKVLGKVGMQSGVAAPLAKATQYVLTLQTPALLIHPGKLAPDGGPGSTSEEDLRTELEEGWKGLSGGMLVLKDYFQRCSLTGGEYFRKRFQKGPVYKPYLLSDEGSTFRLEAAAGAEAAAHQLVTTWVARGLPVGRRLLEFYGIPGEPEHMWEHCPYLPENGYGEVSATSAVQGGVNVFRK
jgi:hypothetical protein